MKIRFLAATLAAACFALPAAAQTATPRVDQRQANQENRISRGVASGQLTAKETARLEHGQAHVLKMEDRAKADGVVTKKEKAKLHNALDNQSKRIARQKHDKQKVKPASAIG